MVQLLLPGAPAKTFWRALTKGCAVALLVSFGHFTFPEAVRLPPSNPFVERKLPLAMNWDVCAIPRSTSRNLANNSNSTLTSRTNASGIVHARIAHREFADQPEQIRFSPDLM